MTSKQVHVHTYRVQTVHRTRWEGRVILGMRQLCATACALYTVNPGFNFNIKTKGRGGGKEAITLLLWNYLHAATADWCY